MSSIYCLPKKLFLSLFLFWSTVRRHYPVPKGMSLRSELQSWEIDKTSKTTELHNFSLNSKVSCSKNFVELWSNIYLKIVIYVSNIAIFFFPLT